MRSPRTTVGAPEGVSAAAPARPPWIGVVYSSAERFEHGFEKAHGSGRAGPLSRRQLLP